MKLTNFGGATGLLEHQGVRILFDPWLGNPKCPDSEQEPERVDVIALTHGHGDHVGETVELAKRFEPEIVANVELKGWLGNKGAPVGECASVRASERVSVWTIVLPPVLQPVERPRVLAADLLRQRVREMRDQPLLRVVHVQTRIVARVDQHVVGAELIDDVE